MEATSNKTGLWVFLSLLIVAGIVGFIIYNKNKKTEVSAVDAESGSGVVANLTSPKYILANCGLNSTLYSKAIGMYNQIYKAAKDKTGNWDLDKLQTRATENEISLQQQVSIEAVYQLYATSHVLTIGQYNDISQAIKNL